MVALPRVVGKALSQLRWKLTLSYIAVTVGSLLVITMALGALFLSAVLVPDRWLTPEVLYAAAQRSAVPIMRNLLSQSPVDGGAIAIWLEEIDMGLAYEELNLGQIRLAFEAAAQMDVMVVDADGTLLGTSAESYRHAPAARHDLEIGQALNPDSVPGLSGPLQAALGGVEDLDRLFHVIEANESLVGAVPVLDRSCATPRVLGAIVVAFRSAPSQGDRASLAAQAASRGLPIFLASAGAVGAVFGSLTARGMSRRIEQLSAVADAWSEGDFSEFVDDTGQDEIGQLAGRLNAMATQLQDLLTRREGMAASEERNRLARDLHDSAKQQALAASFQLGAALTLMERDPATAKAHLKEADGLVDAVRNELTNLVTELRPATVASAQQSLASYCADWVRQTAIDVDFSAEDARSLDPAVTQSLLRILQEALANVARHSAASHVDARLSCDATVVTLTVTDDGVGFDLQARHPGLGLRSMRERAEALGGDLVIETSPGRGTCVEATLPAEGLIGADHG